MTRKKQQVEEWVTAKRAADIMSENSGHTVKQNYVRYHAYHTHRIAHRELDGRTSEYLRSDVEAIIVKEKSKKGAA